MGKSKIETELSEEQLQEFCTRLANTPKLTLKKLQSMAAELGIEVSLMGAKSFRDGAFAEHIEKMRRAKELALQLREVGNADAAGSIADAGALVLMQQVYDALTKGDGNKAQSAEEAMENSYKEKVYDEFVVPVVIEKDGKPTATIKDMDSVIFFNFRPDRAREMTRAFCDDEFTGFERGERKKVLFTCFVDYDETIENKQVAFKKEEITETLGEYLAENGKTQCRVAETEKYAHVTFFFNGGVETPNKGEDRILVPSPKEVPTYDLKPEMSAPMVCEKLCEAISSDKYDVVICNFANPDMVGHTGVIPAAVKAVETVDTCIGKVCEAVKNAGGVLFICADHGNCDKMIDEKTGEPFTAHTTNPVPFILYNADPKYKLREGGVLADIAPTLLELMGMEKPKEMTGKSLLIEK